MWHSICSDRVVGVSRGGDSISLLLRNGVWLVNIVASTFLVQFAVVFIASGLLILVSR